tara:strand:+ start:395 stop:571 length:177 start_codon:yes stop_codon:yes gene_type:complete
MTEDEFLKNWQEAMSDERYYVADNSGLVMLDDVDVETAYVYASKIDGCTAFRKVENKQ